VDFELAFSRRRNCVREFLSCRSRHLTDRRFHPRSFSCGLEGDPDLRQGRDVRVNVRLRATEIGSYEDTLEIRFSRVSNDQLFSVARTVKAIVGDAAGYALLQPTAPYVPRRRSNRQEEIGSVVEGIPPPRLLAIAWRTKLGGFKIPKTFRPIFSLQPNRPETDDEDIVPSQIRSLFGKSLHLSNHAQKFSMLLWIEEVSMECVDDLTQYNSWSMRLHCQKCLANIRYGVRDADKAGRLLHVSLFYVTSGLLVDLWLLTACQSPA
jgi:hypothetical protein